MAVKDKKQSPQDRVDLFLNAFSKESPDIREELVYSLPAYNILLSLHAKTFEEFSLMSIAKKKGYKDYLYSYKDIKPSCYQCGSDASVTRTKENMYFCRKCNKKFTLNQDSICSGTNCSSLTWMKVLYCLLEFYGMKRTCKYCNIAPKTYYYIRTRLFYAMQLMMDNVKLYGLIQCDNTSIRLSYKGYDLKESDFPEDSIFDVIDYIPRDARKRGNRNSNADKNDNSVSVFTAIDNYGHCIARYVGIGTATATKLQHAVPPNRYLFTIPEKDPFSYTFKAVTTQASIPQETLLVSDKETPIAKYAKNMGIPFEAHVYRTDNRQRTLTKGSHNIQKANAMHKRLKDFLRKVNYVSTKYLPGYLILFEFIENTGATIEAIGQLFEILVTPGLGQSKIFFDNLYTVPNIFVEWNEDNKALQNIDKKQMLAAYLYHKKKQYRETDIPSELSMQSIMERTGYQSSGSIRRAYKNIVAAGLIDTVCQYIGAFEEKESAPPKKEKSISVPTYALQYYDSLCELLQLSFEKQCTMYELFNKLNAKHGRNEDSHSLAYFFNRIEKYNLRPLKLSVLKEENRKKKHIAITSRINPKWEESLQTFNEIKLSYIRANKKAPSRTELLQMIGQKVGAAPDTVAEYITKAKKMRREK